MAGSRNAPSKPSPSPWDPVPARLQAIQITCRTPRLNNKRWRIETVYAITSLAAAQTTLAQLAA
jgi:hypothetical protein